MLSDSWKIGAGLASLGLSFIFLGMLFFFDRKLLAMGNILFLTGFGILSGFQRSMIFFGFAGPKWKERWRTRWRGIVSFLGGIVLVLCGWVFSGVLLEGFGFLNLFGSFIPMAVHYIRSIPIVGRIFNLPVISTIADRLGGSKSPNTMV